MAPNTTETPTGVLYDGDNSPDYRAVKEVVKEREKQQDIELPIYWSNVFWFASMQLAGLYGLVLCFTSAHWATTFWAFSLYWVAGLGITAGVHRLWSHRSFKAKLPLQVFLLVLNTMSFQNSVCEWVRDHRVHHKFSETNADPVNSDRGFFFSHVGWLLCKKHPEVTRIGKTIDISDVENDPLLAFQKRYYKYLVFLLWGVVPTMVPTLWGDTAWNGFFVAVMLRYVCSLHTTWLVNSLAHYDGKRPYDKDIAGRENMIVSRLGMGEGFHNYHHCFPWDYKNAELGQYSTNWTTAFIDLMAKIGWAYDMKSVNPEMVARRTKRTGDGSHPVWGWDDKDMTSEQRECAVIHRTTK